MSVNFNPNLNFRQVAFGTNTPQEQQAAKSTDVHDTVEIASKSPENKPKVSGFRNGISKIAKFFASLSEITKASAKGLFYGALTTGTVLAGFWSFGSVPKAFKDKSMQALKSISTKGKVISAIAGAGVLTYHIIKGKLQANKRTANIDHELRTGHDAGKF